MGTRPGKKPAGKRPSGTSRRETFERAAAARAGSRTETRRLTPSPGKKASSKTAAVAPKRNPTRNPIAACTVRDGRERRALIFAATIRAAGQYAKDNGIALWTWVDSVAALDQADPREVDTHLVPGLSPEQMQLRKDWGFRCQAAGVRG